MNGTLAVQLFGMDESGALRSIGRQKATESEKVENSMT